MPRRDDEEFVAFATASRDRLRRTAYLMCGDWHRASDLAQEALIRVYVAWPRLERRGGLAAYARRAVVSAAIDASRRKSHGELATGDAPDRASAQDLAGHVTERAAVVQALAGLPPRQRACVVLRYYEDLPVAEVAALLGVNEGTVKSQTARALATLKTVIGSGTDDELAVSGQGGR